MASGEQLDLPARPDSVAVARSFVRDLVRACDAGLGGPIDPELVEDAMLLVSELVSNAILHGRPMIRLSVSVSISRVEVEVADQGDRLPGPPVAVADPRQARGRGLHLVEQLSTDWGIRPQVPPPGKSVWFSISPDRSLTG